MKQFLYVLVSLVLLTSLTLGLTLPEIEAQYTREMKLAKNGPDRARALKTWGLAGKAAGIPVDRLRPVWVARINELMRYDFYAAYEAILDADYLPDTPRELAALFPEQQSALVKLASYTVDEYNKKGSVVYPADVPMPGHPWGDLTRDPVASSGAVASSSPAAAPSPVPPAWQPRWPVGQFFAVAGSEVPVSVLIKVDPAKSGISS